MEYQSANQSNYYHPGASSGGSRYGLASVGLSRSNKRFAREQQQQKNRGSLHQPMEAEVDDQRQDVGGQQDRGMWDELTSSVHSIGEFLFDWKDHHCQISPCFVKTASMDSSGRAEPPPQQHSYTHHPSYINCTFHQGGEVFDMKPTTMPSPTTTTMVPPSQPPNGAPLIHFPSVHLEDDEDDWEDDDDDDSDAFLQSRDLKNNIRQNPPTVLQVQSIYRTPSSQIGASSVCPFGGITTSNNAPNNFGLYRCPAWAAEDDDETESCASSISAEWEDMSPRYSKKVIDVTDMDQLFEDCHLSG